MTIERLNPGGFIELADPLMGGKKLGLVDETGLGYYELIGDDQLPKPIHAEFSPTQIGTIDSWITGVAENDLVQAVAAWRALTDRNLDMLTLARSLRWGIENRAFADVEMMAQMGQQATDRVKTGREIVSGSFAKA